MRVTFSLIHHHVFHMFVDHLVNINKDTETWAMQDLKIDVS